MVTREDIGYRECMPCQVRIDAPEALRQSILKKAFERKLLGEAEFEACRREPDWEPAEKLLERKVTRQILHYNPDAIISVGYRVNSLRGTQFRQWATKRLKEYLVQGYAINGNRPEQKQQEVRHLKDGIRILSRAIEKKAADADFHWLNLYAARLRLLDDYDHEILDSKGQTAGTVVYPSYEDYMAMVNRMRADVDSTVFGRERGDGFKSAIKQIRQGFGKEELYPTFEEKAAKNSRERSIFQRP